VRPPPVRSLGAAPLRSAPSEWHPWRGPFGSGPLQIRSLGKAPLARPPGSGSGSVLSARPTQLGPRLGPLSSVIGSAPLPLGPRLGPRLGPPQLGPRHGAPSARSPIGTEPHRRTAPSARSPNGAEPHRCTAPSTHSVRPLGSASPDRSTWFATSTWPRQSDPLGSPPRLGPVKSASSALPRRLVPLPSATPTLGLPMF